TMARIPTTSSRPPPTAPQITPSTPVAASVLVYAANTVKCFVQTTRSPPTEIAQSRATASPAAWVSAAHTVVMGVKLPPGARNPTWEPAAPGSTSRAARSSVKLCVADPSWIATMTSASPAPGGVLSVVVCGSRNSVPQPAAEGVSVVPGASSSDAPAAVVTVMPSATSTTPPPDMSADTSSRGASTPAGTATSISPVAGATTTGSAGVGPHASTVMPASVYQGEVSTSPDTSASKSGRAAPHQLREASTI